MKPATEYSLYWDNLTSGWWSWSDCLLPSYCTLHITDTQVTHGVHGTIEYQIRVPFHYTNGNSETQRWGVIWIDPLSFSLLPTPPILLTNDSGSVIWYVYTYGPSYWSQWVKGSELEEGWVKGFNNHWIFHPHRTRNSVLFFVLLLDSGMKSCHLVPLPLTCVECSCFLSPGLLVALRAALVLQKLREQGTEKW